MAYGHANHAKSIFHNPELIPGLFPWLFPYGRGGTNSAIAVTVSPQRHIRFLLNYHDRRFATDYYFPFIVLNHRQIQESSQGAYVLTQRRNFGSVVEKILALDTSCLENLAERGKRDGYIRPLNEEERKCFEILHIIDNVGGHVSASNTQKKYQRNEIRSLMYKLGAPNLFITFSPNDIGSPICIKYCGYCINLDDKFPAMPNSNQCCCMVANNPVAAAKYFHLMVELFMKYVLRFDSHKPGLFDHVSACYVMVESQGRQTLHLHSLSWITSSLSPQELRDKIRQSSLEFEHAVIAWLESCQ